MPDSTYLTEAEIRELTGKVQYAAQCRELARQGFVYTRRADRRPKVLRSHHDRVLGLRSDSPVTDEEPDWSQLDDEPSAA